MWIAPERRRAHRWVAPVFAVAAGVTVGTTLALRGSMETGLVTLVVLLGYAVMLASRGGEAGHGPHDTFGGGGRAGAPARAAAITGDVVAAVTVAALIVQALRGGDIWILAGLAAIACVTYFIAILGASWY
jgi:hypothetical protein